MYRKQNSNKSSIVTTIVVLLVCLVLVTGSTFSLFTSKTGTNIAVTSGNVEMVATIDADSLALYSKGEEQTGKFANGGTATFNEANTELTITNITPGDSVEFNIVLENESTVDLQYRVNWIVEGDLAEALTATVNGADITSGTSEWTLWKADATEKSQTLSISIELPLEADDNWESLEANIAFNVEAVQANATGEYSPVAFVSTAAGLQAALDAGCTEIVFNEDVAAEETLVIPEGAKVDLNLKGNTLAGNIIAANADLTISNGTVENEDSSASAIEINAGSLALEGVTISSTRHAVRIDGEVTATINGGTYYTESGASSLTQHALNVSGNANVTINGGEFVGPKGTGADSGAAVNVQSGATVVIGGGNFSNGLNNTLASSGTLTVNGGTFDQDPANYVADGYSAIDNGDGTYSVLPAIEGVTLSSVSGYPHLYTDGTNYYAYDAQGLIAMRDFWQANWCGNNMWNRSYNVMADINATGYTWNNVWVNVGSNENNGFVFDGHGHTITGLTINGGLFSGTPNGANKPENPGYVKDITFDGVKVVGDHFAGVLWSNVYNELVVENVSVINSQITGKCNVAALVGATVVDGASDASVKFINCVVKNNVITAEGKDGQDPNGANVFLSRAYGKTSVTFENCVSDGNTLSNNNGLVGGGIYGYTVWANGGFTGTGTCDSFATWNGLVADVSSLDEALSSGEDVVLADDLTFNASETTANSGYGATGVSVKGGVLDGNGNSIGINNWGTWDATVHTTGGTIKNLTINSGMRGIFMGSATADLYIDNVVIDGTVYTFNSDGGSKDYGVYISNSTLNGWTSFSDVHKEVKFTNCTFGEGSGYAFCRPYNAPTVFENCVFEEGFEFDTSKTSEITFINCYYGETLITAENAESLALFYNGLNGATIK